MERSPLDIRRHGLFRAGELLNPYDDLLSQGRPLLRGVLFRVLVEVIGNRHGQRLHGSDHCPPELFGTT